MIFARRWRERCAFWPALVFWVWLASFVFGFAASDLMHAPNCPEGLALRAAAPSHDARGAHLSASHVLHLDADCPTCLLQGAVGILSAAMLLLVPLIIAFSHPRLRVAPNAARALSYGARGPPVSFI